jgi:hypothetical protein
MYFLLFSKKTENTTSNISGSRIVLGEESSGEGFSQAKNHPAKNSPRRRIIRVKNFLAKNYTSGYPGK